MKMLAYGFITGILFGFLLQKGRVLRYDKQLGALRLIDMTIVKFMLSSIMVGMVGIYLLKDLGIVELSVKAAILGAVIPGGLIFGIGWGFLGYCPGTSLGALGEGLRPRARVRVGPPRVRPILQARCRPRRVILPDDHRQLALRASGDEEPHHGPLADGHVVTGSARPPPGPASRRDRAAHRRERIRPGGGAVRAQVSRRFGLTGRASTGVNPGLALGVWGFIPVQSSHRPRTVTPAGGQARWWLRSTGRRVVRRAAEPSGTAPGSRAASFSRSSPATVAGRPDPLSPPAIELDRRHVTARVPLGGRRRDRGRPLVARRSRAPGRSRPAHRVSPAGTGAARPDPVAA